MTKTYDIMGQWALWRHYKHHGGYGRTILDKLLSGMPGRGCPVCRRKGRVDGLICPVCHGKGTVELDKHNNKINPAFIRQTSKYYGNALMERVDRIVSDLRRDPKTQSQYFVILAEFCRNGTQEVKANRMGISDSYYSRLLKQAIEHIDQSLGYHETLEKAN